MNEQNQVLLPLGIPGFLLNHPEELAVNKKLAIGNIVMLYFIIIVDNVKYLDEGLCTLEEFNAWLSAFTKEHFSKFDNIEIDSKVLYQITGKSISITTFCNGSPYGIEIKYSDNKFKDYKDVPSYTSYSELGAVIIDSIKI
jgi:hypothetical protein